MANLLPITVVLPMAGALLLWLSPAKSKIAVRQSALITTVLTLALTAILLKDYTLAGGPYSEWIFRWLGADSAIDVQCSLALDGLSVWLFGLTSLLMVTAVLVSWESIEDRPASYYGLLLLLQTGMLGVFAARDIILFYVFFEFTLIPLFFLIGVWGSEDRRYAAIKFFIFTLAGSLLTFVGLLAIVLWNYENAPGGFMTFSISELTAGLARNPLPATYQLWIFLALFAGFAIKVPLFPLHTWLPLAHVQAPAAGSVILAGVLLKIGTYGFLRFSMAMLPEATAACAGWLLWLSVAGIIYGALVALVQTDMKRLIAYSSVSHLGFCMLGLFSLTRLGTQGSVLQMINHGLSTGGLFAIVGMLYERYHTREIAQFGGLSRRTPWLAFFFVFFTFSSIGLPGLNGFAGEFLILLGMFERAWMGTSSLLRIEFTAIATLSVLGVVLGAWYMLFLVQRVFFGPLKEPAGHAGDHVAGHDNHASAASHDSHGHAPAAALPPGVSDMSLREAFALMPLVVFMLWIGLWPQFFLDRMSGTVEELTKVATQQFDEKYGPTAAPTAVAEVGATLSVANAPFASEKTTADVAGPLTFGRRGTAQLPAEELTRAN